MKTAFLASITLLLLFNAHASAQQAASSAKIGVEMVLVEGGTFVMGCADEPDTTCRAEERPARCVTLDNFHIGKYEVTQKLWVQVMGENPSKWTGDDSRPVEGVNWNMAQEFIKKLNGMTGKAYRLPTEAEWEYAARGGLKSEGYRYAGGNNLGEVAWFSGNSERHEVSRGGKYNVKEIYYKTHPVGQKRANELGIHDMAGNVREWVSDVYGEYVWKAGEANPLGPAPDSEYARRVARGCSKDCDDEKSDRRRSVRVISRASYSVGDEAGFRLALDAPKSKSAKKTKQAESYNCAAKPRFVIVADSLKAALEAKSQRCKKLPKPPERTAKQSEALVKEFRQWLEKELLPNMTVAKLIAASHDSIDWHLGGQSYVTGVSEPKDFIPDYFKFMQRDWTDVLKPGCEDCSIYEDVNDGANSVATKSSKYFDDCDRYKYWEHPLIVLSLTVEDGEQARYSFMRAGKGFKLVSAIIRDREATEIRRQKREAAKKAEEEAKRAEKRAASAQRPATAGASYTGTVGGKKMAADDSRGGQGQREAAQAAQPQEAGRATQKFVLPIEEMIKGHSESLARGDIASAGRILQAIMTNYPADHRAWWASIATSTQNFTMMMAHKSSLDSMLDMVKNNSAPAEFAKYKKEYDAFIEKMEQKLDDGLIRAAKGGGPEWEIEALKEMLGRTAPRKKK
ncbi:MAG: formylglycine-generating enzyme family protein [Chitinispirillia bacterium]|nr:formylglycine-generating enzyme family protein [Chitinispirillia bacterium]MCL2241727.1 formylglycine-generating enzyme family protein [Chitinispirillia bacterium]